MRQRFMRRHVMPLADRLTAAKPQGQRGSRPSPPPASSSSSPRVHANPLRSRSSSRSPPSASASAPGSPPSAGVDGSPGQQRHQRRPLGEGPSAPTPNDDGDDEGALISALMGHTGNGDRDQQQQHHNGGEGVTTLLPQSGAGRRRGSVSAPGAGGASSSSLPHYAQPLNRGRAGSIGDGSGSGGPQGSPRGSGGRTGSIPGASNFYFAGDSSEGGGSSLQAPHVPYPPQSQPQRSISVGDFEASFLARQAAAEDARRREIESLRSRLEAARVAAEAAAVGSTPSGSPSGSIDAPLLPLDGSYISDGSRRILARLEAQGAPKATRAGLARLTAPTASARARMAEAGGPGSVGAGSVDGHQQARYPEAADLLAGADSDYQHQLHRGPPATPQQGGAPTVYFTGAVVARSAATLARRDAAVRAVLEGEDALRNRPKASDYSTALVRRRLAREVAVVADSVSATACATAPAAAAGGGGAGGVGSSAAAGVATVQVPWWLLPLRLADVAVLLARCGFLPHAESAVPAVAAALAAAGLPSQSPLTRAQAQHAQAIVLDHLPSTATSNGSSGGSGISARLLARVWLAMSLPSLAHAIGADGATAAAAEEEAEAGEEEVVEEEGADGEVNDGEGEPAPSPPSAAGDGVGADVTDGSPSPPVAASETAAPDSDTSLVPAVRLLCLLQSVVTRAYDVQPELLLSAGVDVGLRQPPCVPVPAALAHACGLGSGAAAALVGEGVAPGHAASASAGSAASASADASNPFAAVLAASSARLRAIAGETAVSPLKGTANSSSPLRGRFGGTPLLPESSRVDGHEAPDGPAPLPSAGDDSLPFLALARQPLSCSIYWPGSLLHPLRRLYANRLNHMGSLKRTQAGVQGGSVKAVSVVASARKARAAAAAEAGGLPRPSSVGVGAGRRGGSVGTMPPSPFIAASASAEGGSSSSASLWDGLHHHTLSGTTGGGDEECTFVPLLSRRSLALAARRDAQMSAQLLGTPAASSSQPGSAADGSAGDDASASASAAGSALRLPREVLLLAYGAEKAAKAAAMRAAAAAVELAECSFRPDTGASVASYAGPGPASGASALAESGIGFQRGIASSSSGSGIGAMTPGQGESAAGMVPPGTVSRTAARRSGSIEGRPVYVPPYAQQLWEREFAPLAPPSAAATPAPGVGAASVSGGDGGEGGRSSAAELEEEGEEDGGAPASPSAAGDAAVAAAVSGDPWLGPSPSRAGGGRGRHGSPQRTARKTPHAYPASSFVLPSTPGDRKVPSFRGPASSSSFSAFGGGGGPETPGGAAEGASAAPAVGTGFSRTDWLFALASAKAESRKAAKVALDCRRAASELEGCTFAPSLGPSASSYSAVSSILNASALLSASAVGHAQQGQGPRTPARGGRETAGGASGGRGRGSKRYDSPTASSASRSRSRHASAPAHGGDVNAGAPGGSTSQAILGALSQHAARRATGGTPQRSPSASPTSTGQRGSSPSAASGRTAAAAVIAANLAAAASSLPPSRGMEAYLRRMAKTANAKQERAVVEAALAAGQLHRVRRGEDGSVSLAPPPPPHKSGGGSLDASRVSAGTVGSSGGGGGMSRRALNRSGLSSATATATAARRPGSPGRLPSGRAVANDGPKPPPASPPRPLSTRLAMHAVSRSPSPHRRLVVAAQKEEEERKRPTSASSRPRSPTVRGGPDSPLRASAILSPVAAGASRNQRGPASSPLSSSALDSSVLSGLGGPLTEADLRQASQSTGGSSGGSGGPPSGIAASLLSALASSGALSRGSGVPVAPLRPLSAAPPPPAPQPAPSSSSRSAADSTLGSLDTTALLNSSLRSSSSDGPPPSASSAGSPPLMFVDVAVSPELTDRVRT